MEITIQEAQKIITEAKLFDSQRQNTLLSYAARVSSLNQEIKLAQDKLANINKILTEHFSQHANEFKKREDVLADKIAEVDRQREISNRNLSDSSSKLETIKKIESTWNEKITTHEVNVSSHINASNLANEEIRQKAANVFERDLKSKAINEEASRKLQLAIEKEKEVEAKSEHLAHISSNTALDIAAHKNLVIKNQLLLDEVNRKREEIESINGEIKSDKLKIQEIHDSIKRAQSELDAKNVELMDKADAIRAQQIKLELAAKTHKQNVDTIAGKISQLHDLKNDVEKLIQLKEAKEA